jgi:plastocyanin
MKTNIFVTIVSGLLVILAFDTGAFATKHRISAADFQFSPKTIPSVHLGDTIRWYWLNGMHTTTSDTIPAGAVTWDHPIDINDTIFEYVPVLLGTYKYHCSFHFLSNGMAGSYTVISAAGISNKNPEIAFSLYPNPVISNLTIRVKSTDSYIRDLKIYDLAGNMIREVNIVTSPGIADKTIDLSDLHRGIFLLEFLDNHNNQYIRKVIKL